MYSSIEEEMRKNVIDSCYWPLFRLIESGYSICIEASGITLEIILAISPEWIKKLKSFIDSGKVKFIGSGYSQVIGPLSPAKANAWNIKLGLEVYDDLLGNKPDIALVNEMAYSAGIIEHYIDSGYKAIIMEWNNPRSSHQDWENDWRYFPQYAVGTDRQTLPVVWADSIGFQKFQRYAHGENNLDDFIDYLKTHNNSQKRFFPLYCNDVEIFDFRPNRYQTEADKNVESEFERIFNLYRNLENEDWVEFVYPSEVIDGLSNPKGGNELNLESLDRPIPVKKQEKYNINRWALSGRDDHRINTTCYQIINAFVKSNNSNPDDWRELCYLWSSDFRTHITEKRWDEFSSRLSKFSRKWSKKNLSTIDRTSEIRSSININEVAENINIENNKLRLSLNKNKGLTIKEFVFKELSDKPLFGTLSHGYYDDISLGADFYSGHTVIKLHGEHKVTDLGKVKPETHYLNTPPSLTSHQKWGDYSFQNKLSVGDRTLTIEKEIKILSYEKSIIHPINFTLIPSAWDKDSLYIQTHCGGTIAEKFFLRGQNIAHGEIYSSLISARHAFGNTAGQFIVGDKKKSIIFNCDMSLSALIPSIDYLEKDNTFFFRLQYSASELDETTKKRSFNSKLLLKISY